MQLFFQSITEIISDSLKSKQHLEVIMTKLIHCLRILQKSVKIFFFDSIAHKSSKRGFFLLLKDIMMINNINKSD